MLRPRPARHRRVHLSAAIARAAIVGAAIATISTISACGTPADPPDGEGGSFARASMQGSGGQESLVSTRSIELVSWLVQFNRLNSAEKLESMLNKKPGQFFPVDADGDGTHDFIGVEEEAKAKRGAHALVLSAKPKADGEGTKVATLFFDGDWGFLGYERMGAGAPPSATAIAAAAGTAATYAARTPAPSPAAPAKAEGPSTITLRLAAGGLMTLDGQTVGEDQLGERVKGLVRDRPGIKIIVDSDAAVPQSQVTARVDMLLEAGITQVAFNERPASGAATAVAQADGASAVRAVGAGSDEAAGVRPATP